MSALRDKAIAFAEAGIPVFPCIENGKVPACEGGFKAATTDLEQINAWWNDNENYNVAICPEDAGWCVVDLDPGSADAWGKLVADNGGVGETYTVRTPRGGYHYYFNGSLRSSASKLAPHVDTRGVGGYVLVPPSIIDGKAYEVSHDVDVLPVPSWIERGLEPRAAGSNLVPRPEVEASPASRDRAAAHLRTLVNDGDVAISGRGGNQRTYDLVTKLAGLCPDAPTVAALLKDIWNPKCDPPWTDEEIDTFVVNGFKYRQDEPGNYDDAGLPSQTFGASFGADILASLPEQSKAKAEKQSRFMIRDEKDMDDRPEPKWIVKDLIPDDSVCLWLGASQSFKSFLLLDVLLGVAAGTETFGDIPEAGVVIYGAIEDLPGIEGARRKAWKSSHGLLDVPVDNFHTSLVPRIEQTEDIDEWMDQIEKKLKGTKLKIVAIDTAGKSIGGQNENESAVVRQFWAVCDALRERFGCTVVAIHHSGKDAARGARGSSAWSGDFDTIIETNRPSKDHLNVKVSVTKHKNAADGQSWTFRGRQHAGSLVFDPIKVSDYEDALEETSDKITPKKIGKLLAEAKAHDLKSALSTTEVWMKLGSPSMERVHTTAQGSRELEKLSDTFLRAYCERDDKNVLHWYYQRREA